MRDPPRRAWPLLFVALLLPASLAAGASGSWPMGPRDIEGSRHADRETRITRESVEQLEIAWSFETEGAATGTPTVRDGKLYAATWKGNVYCLDAATGALVWTYASGVQVDASVTLWRDLAIFGDAHGRLHALNATSGTPVWNVTVDTTRSAHLYATPIVADLADRSILLMGVASDQESIAIHKRAPLDFRGQIAAYSPSDGALLWRTYLVPPGHTGAPLWGTPVVALEEGLALFGTGNAYDEPAANTTDSVMAVDLRTGEMKWSYQATEDDIFTQANPTSPDWDFGSTGSLFSTASGQRLFVIGQKSSEVRAFDVATGELVWEHGEAKKGASIIAGSAYAEGRLAVGYLDGHVIIFNASNGTQRWSHLMSAPVFSGSAIANGIVFAGDSSGNVSAFDLHDGTILWQGSTEGLGTIYGGLSLVDGHLYAPTVASGFLGAKGAIVAWAPHATTSPTPTTSSPTPATITSPPTPPATAPTVTVTMSDYLFIPDAIRVTPGTIVRWDNLDPALHTATSGWDDGAAFDLLIGADAQGEHTFHEPGTYVIVCTLHAGKTDDGVWEGMVGAVVVEHASTPTISGSAAGIGAGAIPGLGAPWIIGALVALAWWRARPLNRS